MSLLNVSLQKETMLEAGVPQGIARDEINTC
jgi:hypothetical protein